jgi:AraC family transcriptional regulator
MEMAVAPNFERYSKEFNPMTGTALIEVWMPVNDPTKET